MAGGIFLLAFFSFVSFGFCLNFFSDFRHHQEIYSNLKISSLVTMTCQCQLLSWQSNLVQKMAKGYAMNIIYQYIYGSFENEALENEDRSTKHPNLENEAPKTRKRSTLDRKRSTQKFDTGLSFIDTRIQQECSSNLLKL